MKAYKNGGEGYLRGLGLAPAENMAQLSALLEPVVGKAQSARLLAALERRGTGAIGGRSRQETAAFYQLKNEDPQASLILSAAHDWALLRQTCDWAAAHQDAFGATLLDVGCDCGLLSCFLAQLLPGTQITSIDRSGNAIRAAQALARRLHLTNITFRHRGLEELPAGERYDTVFSSRTVQENYDPMTENARFLPLTRQGRICAQSFARYAGLLTAPLRPGGTLVTVERLERDRVFLGYCLALNQCGIDLRPESYAELHCQEGERTAVLQAFCGVKENRTDAAAAEDFFIASFQDKLTWQPEHLDTEGELILELCAEELLRGHLLHTAQGVRVGKLAVYTSRVDPEELFYYQGIVGQPVRLHRLSRAALEEVLALQQADLQAVTGNGLRALPFRWENGEEVLVAE